VKKSTIELNRKATATWVRLVRAMKYPQRQPSSFGRAVKVMIVISREIRGQIMKIPLKSLKVAAIVGAGCSSGRRFDLHLCAAGNLRPCWKHYFPILNDTNIAHAITYRLTTCLTTIED